MADGKGIVCRNIACAEARTAETGLEECACLQQLLLHAVSDQLQVDRNRRGIDRQRKVAAADVEAAQNRCCLGDIVIHAARTAGNDALIDLELATFDLLRQMKLRFAAKLLMRAKFHLSQIIAGVCNQLAQRHRLRRVEGKRRHRFQTGKIDLDAAVIVRALFNTQRAVAVRSSMDGEVFFDLFVRLPDGAETGGLGRHDVDADAEVHRKCFHAGTGKFENLVFDEAVFIDCAAKRNGDIMRTDAVGNFTRQPDEHDLRLCYIVGVLQQLLDKLWSAFADAHGADGAVAGMAVGTEQHFAAAGHHLARVLVNDCLICRYVIAAVFDCR